MFRLRRLLQLMVMVLLSPMILVFTLTGEGSLREEYALWKHTFDGICLELYFGHEMVYGTNNTNEEGNPNGH